jgi:hypothetical protein
MNNENYAQHLAFNLQVYFILHAPQRFAIRQIVRSYIVIWSPSQLVQKKEQMKHRTSVPNIVEKCDRFQDVVTSDTTGLPLDESSMVILSILWCPIFHILFSHNDE